MKKFSIIAMLALALTGCEHARSFMQMDSNSGSPFLGLQLSVDADDPSTPDIAEVSPTAGAPQSWLQTAAQSESEANFVLTSQSRVSNGNLKYSLPRVDLSRDAETAAEIEEIRQRL